MTSLYTYILRHDAGSAPNPFGPCCTLAICKPSIRRAAKAGDWVAGFGAKHTELGDYRGRLVYAMLVTDKLTMEEYDALVRSRWDLEIKLPDWQSGDLARTRGDCIYDFGGRRPVLRPSIHDSSQRERDLGGRYVLLSRDFYYFGRTAVPVPPSLAEIVPTTQGHRSEKNRPFVAGFDAWIRRHRRAHNRVSADPIGWGGSREGRSRGCGIR